MHIGKIGIIGRAYRHMQRYRQILTVLFRYGFGDLVNILKIEQYIEIGLQMISRKRREKIETLTDHRYGASSVGAGGDRFDATTTEDMGDVACRVVADHARTLTFAIADGIIPSNEGRGYVLRRILRRAARYARQYLNIEGAFLVELVPTVVEAMGEMFGEIRQRGKYVIETIGDEEASFARTLDRGIELFQRQAESLIEKGVAELPGDVAFDLYATYGFPVDLTRLMAQEKHLTVDMGGYEKAMAQHRLTSSAGANLFKAAESLDLPACDDSAKYDLGEIEATVLGWVSAGQYVTTGSLAEGDGAFPNDFIEIYNPEPLPVDFGGLYLTNDPATAADMFLMDAQHDYLPTVIRWREGHGGNRRKAGLQRAVIARPQIPDAGGAVAAAGHDARLRVILREGDGIHAVTVAGEDL